MATGISRNGPCVCGSGLRFKRCCGQIDAPHWNKAAIGRLAGGIRHKAHQHLIENEPTCEFDGQRLPPGLFARQLDDSYSWQTLAAALTTTRKDHSAEITGASGRQKFHPQRVTTIVDQGDWADAVTDLVRRAYRNEVEPFFNTRLRWFEAPQVLRYTSGGYYRPHCDSDGWNKEKQVWEPALDRHLSLLIYLDDDYDGGELVFPNFDFKLNPRSGLLVAFPSDHRYLHGAMPVLFGHRHAIVSWSAVAGKPLLHAGPPEQAQLMHARMAEMA